MATRPGNAGGYSLMRDASATTRLTAQHYLWNQTLGFSIHPEIPIPKSGARIADVATGAGHWMLDVSRQLGSSAKLDGFDVSLDQCPPHQWLPDNVKTHQWDMFEDPPEEFVGQFDLVHIRLVIVAIKNNDPAPAIVKLVKLLKPGGYLQWDEVINSQAYVLKVNPSLPAPAVEELKEWMATPKKGLGPDSWKWGLPETLKKHGFQDATLHQYVDNYAKDKSLIRAYTASYIVLCEEFVNNVFAPHEDEFISHKARLEKAIQEASQGAGIVFPQIICVAQKAS